MRSFSYLLLIAALMLLVITALLRPFRTTKAAPQEIFGVCVSQVPGDWGQFKGGSEQTGLAFEDRHGTLRFITSFPCNSAVPPVALEVRRTPSNP
jgi:hypothetical protein